MNKHILLSIIVLLFSGTLFAQEAKKAVPKQPNLRIVDYGSDMGEGIYRDHTARLFNDIEFDADGDGETSDDSVSGWEFSLDEPLSPSGPFYNTQAPSHRYYGGIIGVHANQPRARLTEGFLNSNHELRDDMNFMSNQGTSSKRAGNTIRGWGVWLWRKSDFLNHGDKFKVTFDDNSLLAVHISRYWDDIDGGRWVVRDGDTFYISEATFGTPDDIEKRGKSERLSWWLNPTKTRWAVYTPKAPYNVRFNPDQARFARQNFENVSATGFYLFKDSKTLGVISVKWHSFETWAVVDVPQRPSLHLDMARIDEGNLSMAVTKDKLSYKEWFEVYNWAVSNQYTMDLDHRGYVFDRDGDMGQMDRGQSDLSAEATATDMTWLDAVLWCNALSELEGLTPCYYLDASHRQVLRKIRERNRPERYGWKPDVHVKWDADGYRLPTGKEWVWSARRSAVNNNLAGEYEFIWGPTDASPSVIEANTDKYYAMGGAKVPDSFNNWIYPGGASPLVGFRPIRVLAGSTENLVVEQLAEIPWVVLPAEGKADERKERQFDWQGDRLVKIENGNYIRGDEARVTVSDYYISKTEVPFRVWNIVYQAALPLGYQFDRDGDMGSMDWNPGDTKHAIEEPVTDIGWYDCLVWCNALSELTGRTPVYYTDEAKTQVFRTALPWRIRMVAEGHGADHVSDIPIYTKWEANGFRLPTWAEWYIALRAGDGNYQQREGKQWTLENANARTHPVDTGDPNPWSIYNLQGNVSEWLHDVPVNDYYRPENPKGDMRDSLFGMSIAGGNFNTPASFDSGRAKEKNRKSAGWPWLGFRIVRCETGAHSTKPFVPKVVLDVKAEDYDPLQGRTFRANMRRNGRYANAGLPELNGEKWRFKTGGPVLSSPVVVDGVVYVGSNDGYFYAIDVTTGRQRWKFNTGGAVEGSTVIGRDGTAYIGSASGWLYAIDTATGEEKWKYAYDERQPSRQPVMTSPGLAHGVVFAGFGKWGGAYVGVDAETGKAVWKLRGRSPNDGLLGPTVDGTTFYAPVNDNVLMAADIRTEIPLENFDNSGHHCKASVAILGDHLFYQRGPALKIARKTDGRKLAELYLREAGLSFFPQSGPTATEDRGYVAKGNNVLYCLDIKGMPTLPEIWTVDLPAQVRSSLGLAGNTLYFGCDDGNVYALDRHTGKKRWNFKTDGPVASSPWIDQGAVYVGSEDGFVYALK